MFFFNQVNRFLSERRRLNEPAASHPAAGPAAFLSRVKTTFLQLFTNNLDYFLISCSFLLQFVRKPAAGRRSETFAGFSSRTSHQQLHEVRAARSFQRFEAVKVWHVFLSVSVTTCWLSAGCWTSPPLSPPAAGCRQQRSGESDHRNEQETAAAVGIFRVWLFLSVVWEKSSAASSGSDRTQVDKRSGEDTKDYKDIYDLLKEEMWDLYFKDKKTLNQRFLVRKMKIIPLFK